MKHVDKNRHTKLVAGAHLISITVGGGIQVVPFDQHTIVDLGIAARISLRIFCVYLRSFILCILLLVYPS